MSADIKVVGDDHVPMDIFTTTYFSGVDQTRCVALVAAVQLRWRLLHVRTTALELDRVPINEIL